MPTNYERVSWAIVVAVLATHIANPNLTNQVVRSIPYLGAGATGHDQSGSSLGSELDRPAGTGSADTGIERSPITSPHLFDVDINKLNFSDIAIHIFKPSEVKFTTKGDNPQSETFLKHELQQMYFVSNKESMGDFIAKLIYMAKLKDQNQPKPAPVGTSLVPTSSSEGARYTLDINPIADKSSTGIERRPKNQEKALGFTNCGIGTGRFDLFAKNHLIYVTDDNLPEEYPDLSYMAAIERRIHQAIESFTFFLTKATTFIDYYYYESMDECYTEMTLPTYTCHRFNKEDQIVGCLANGLCRPTYKKSTGHLVPVQCEGNTARTMPDMRVSVNQMLKLQSEFLRDLVKAPPTRFDWLMAAYRARRWAAKNRGEDFNEEPPAYEQSEREMVLRNYETSQLEMPEEVRKLFYALPKFYFQRNAPMRKNPENPNCGVLSIADVHLSVCPNYKKVDLTKPPFNWGEIRLPTTSDSEPSSPGASDMYFEDEVFAELGAVLTAFGNLLNN